MKKFLAIIFHSLFCFPFLLFLYLAGIENYTSIRKILFIICVAILLIIGIGQPKFYKTTFETDKLITIPLVLLGTISTYSLQIFANFNPILSAAIVGLIAIFSEKRMKILIALPVYCGAFVGMTNPDNHYSFYLIFLIGLFAGVLFYLSKNFYAGVGGKLGTIAFASVIAGVLILKYVNHAIPF